MFDFLFRNRKPTEKPETQRERFERLILELNEVIDALPHKPAVTVHPESGRISFTMPSQFMDEALALPKPDPSKAEPDTSTVAAARDASDQDGAKPTAPDPAVKKAAAPVPRPPKASPPKPRAPK